MTGLKFMTYPQLFNAAKQGELYALATEALAEPTVRIDMVLQHPDKHAKPQIVLHAEWATPSAEHTVDVQAGLAELQAEPDPAKALQDFFDRFVVAIYARTMAV